MVFFIFTRNLKPGTLSMEAIFLMGAVQALFFTILVITKKQKNPSDFILGLWLFFLAVHLTVPFYVFKDFPDNIHLAGIDLGLFVSHTILLYIYSCALTGKKRGIKPYLIHIVILICTNCLMIPVIIMPVEEKIRFSQNISEAPVYFWVILVIIYLINCPYLVSTLRLLKSHKAIIKNCFSNIEKRNLNWLYNLTIGLCLFYIVNISGGTFLFLLDIIPLYIDFLTYSLLTVLVYAIGFFGFRQGNIFVYDKNLTARKTEPAEKSASSPLPGQANRNEDTKGEDRIFSQKVLGVMEEQKPHLQNDLTLYNLASLLEVTPHYISHILNNYLGSTFYDFINSYRIKEVKQKIASGESKKYTLLSLAFESGFNSKASFNRIFKKQTGVTPSQYLKNRSHSSG